MISKNGVDYLQVVIAINLVAIIVLLGTALVITVQNRASSNLVLGTSALGGAVVIFLIQLSFELRQEDPKRDHMSVAYTFDLSKKHLRQSDYSKLDSIEISAGRVPLEIEAGQWIFNSHATLVQNSRRKIASDLALFSVVGFFGNIERDWQWSVKKYNAPAFGFSTKVPLSKPSECSSVTESELRSKLRQAGNLFADAPVTLTLGNVCFPPDTRVAISATSFELRNPLFEFVIEVEDPGGDNFVEPGSNGNVPKLSDGRPRFENHLRGLNVSIKFIGLRARHPLRPRYDAWLTRTTEELNKWFACC